MKRFFFLCLAAVLIGFVLFALLHWLFGMSQADASGYAFSAALAGLGAEYLGPFINQIFRNRVEE
jgi:hypothetical protein